MAFGLTIGTERATALQNSIQDELMKRGFSPDADPVMAEYITIMIINNKTQAQISSELEDLIGSDFDTTFVEWLFMEAAKGAPESEAPAAAEPSSSQPSARDSPPHINNEAQRRPPNGPRSGVPLYQQAISAALPSTSPTAQKRSASARSPSPTGHTNKSRRMDLPTAPRAMQSRDGPGGAGHNRSLLERMGPRNGHGAGPFPPDDIQARIDTITNASPEQQMMMMQAGGYPMGGMDMNGMAGMNPFALQEMLMAHMAMMSQFAGAMGVMVPPGGGQMMNGGFAGMGQDGGMFHGGMNGMQHGEAVGRGRQRGRGGPGQRGSGRGRGGHTATNGQSENAAEQPRAPGPTAVAIVAPTPTSAAPAPSIVQPVAPAPSTQARTGFVAPERPQSPTLCKYALKCTNPACRYSHPSPVATAESGVVLSNDPCENGKDCKDKDCIKAHVSPAVLNPNAAEHLKPSVFVPPPPPTVHGHSQTPCRYGSACTRQASGCPYVHPTSRPVEHKIASSTPCRFGAACTRASCPFQHPEGRVLPSTFHRGLSTSGPLVSVQTPEAGSMGGPSPHRSITFNKTGGSAAELEKKLKEMEEKKSEAEKAVAQAEKAAAGKKDDPSKPVSITA